MEEMSKAFFAHLTSGIYLNSNVDCVLICGDFNARISNEKDYIAEIDKVQERTALDLQKNGHGESLLGF